jgi:hypothetical protein
MQNETVIQLDPLEAIEANKFAAELDAQVAGFRLGVEIAKQRYLQMLAKKAKPAPAAPAPPAPTQ